MNTKRLLLLFGALIVGGLLFWYSAGIQKIYLDAVDFFQPFLKTNPLTGALIFVGLGALSAMLAPLSSVPLVPAAVLWWGEITSLLLLMAGWLLGACFTYSIGWYAGNPLVRRFLLFQRIDHYKKQLPKKAAFSLVLLFRLAMPAEIPGYVLGAVRYEFWRYFAATFLAELPFALMTVYASEALVEQKPATYILISALGICTILFLIAMFRNALKEHRKNEKTGKIIVQKKPQ